MKKLFLILTTVCAVALGLDFVSTAHADDNGGGLDLYPDSFLKSVSLSGVTDFAADENKFAFLSDDGVYEYTEKSFSRLGDKKEGTTALAYKDGALCYESDGNGYYYGTDESAEAEFGRANITLNSGYHYYYDKDDVLCVLNQSTNEVTPLNGYSNIKECAGKMYALCGGEIYVVSGSETQKVALSYYDYSDTAKIKTGSFISVIRTFSIDSPLFVNIKAGSYMTEVSLDELNGEFFKTGETVKSSAKTALLLATCGTDGKISVIMLCGEDGKSGCYLLNTGNTTPLTRQAVAEKELITTVTTDGYLYTAPYACESTQLTEISAGDKLEVIGEIKRADNPELIWDFYKVELKKGEEKKVGYVPLGFVSNFVYEENPPVVTPDPDESYEDAIKPVLLTIIVVILVLSAAGFIIYTATSRKNNGNKK